MTGNAHTCVVIPTLNEAGTIEQLCVGIQKSLVDCHILIIDDNSTDGTVEIVQSLIRNNSNIQIIVRATRMGIGSAHKLGITEASRNGFRIVATMDADLTHDPSDLPILLDGLEHSELVVGSRFVEGGGLDNWSLDRRILTHVGHIATQVLLQFDYDSSSGFRAYKLTSKVLSAVDRTPSSSYAFFPQSIAIANHIGVQITQVPVVLPSRTYGHSKMRFSDLKESVTCLVQIRKLLKSFPVNE